MNRRRPRLALLPILLWAPLASLSPEPAAGPAAAPPNVVLITVDTLRADRVSAYGYARPTTPNLDRLMAAGLRFTQARTVEPLTAPALCSMLMSVYPHEHGASRNGLRVRAGLASLPKALSERGYRTAAFVSNWTLRDKLSGLAEHFELYEEVLTKRRWFGLIRGEANAGDITSAAVEWLDDHGERRSGQPFFLWVHYTDPHAPYKLHGEFSERLGIGRGDDISSSDRYDSEIAYTDRSIGVLLDRVGRESTTGSTLIAFAADHGESLGEHGYWGHGRHLYEPTLRIPMSVTWTGRIPPRVVDAPALIIDLAPTLLGLLGLDGPPGFRGFDWTVVIDGAEQPSSRVTSYQAHRGAVISRHDSELARKSGLLAVGVILNNRKEIFRVERQRRRLFDLASDPGEVFDLTVPKEDPSEGLQAWMRDVYTGLSAFDETATAVEPLDEESIERLRSLGYVD